jgi:putative FmdB family regulatory protein
MPIYEYRCRECAEEFEVMQKISDRPLRKCRSCGGRLDKLLSQTAFVLRGSGWYSDGYSGRKPDQKPSGEAGKASKQTKKQPAAAPEKKASSSGSD